MPKVIQKDTVTLTIDGNSVTVPKGTMAVDAAKTVGVDIPVFCYHEKLGPFGCCRMCLVEVEKMPKLVTACTLAVGPDMVIKTDTPKVVKGREGVLEFTLLNHPLDCPVCDKGGECPLQDNTFDHGPSLTRQNFDRFNREKAVPLSPVITIDRERCIACQRCTRYSDIIEKETALVMLNRGFKNRVSTFCDRDYDTKFSGNVVDICPVGALTNTTYRFKSRNWDLENSESLCAHCGCNCNIVIGTRLNRFMRVQARSDENARANDFVNDGWICDKGRFGYEFVESKNRVGQSRDNKGNKLSAQEASSLVAESLKKIVDEHGPNSVGFIGSPYGTNEELYLYQKLFRMGLGTNNIDHKIYADSPGLPVDHYDMEDIETSDLVLMIASDPSEELPILDLRLKKATGMYNVKVASLNDQSTALDKFCAISLKYDVGTDAEVITALTNYMTKKQVKNFDKNTGIPLPQFKELVEELKSSKKVCVIYNPSALTGNSVHLLKELLTAIKGLPDTECGAIPSAPGTNAVGAMDLGILPDCYPGGVSMTDSQNIQKQWGENAPVETGASALEMIQKAASGELKGLVIYRSNPVVDFPGGKATQSALEKLDFLAVHDMLETETTRLGHVVIASNGPGYDEGTTTNIGGRVQWRRRGIETRDNPPDWSIIAGMISALDESAPTYKDSFGVTDEISKAVPGYENINKKAIKEFGLNRGSVEFKPMGQQDSAANGKPDNGQLKLKVAHYLFAHDKILDASSAMAHQFKPSTVYLNEEDAKSLNINNEDEVKIATGSGEMTAQVIISNRCNPGGVVIPRVSDEQGLADLISADEQVTLVTIKK